MLILVFASTQVLAETGKCAFPDFEKSYERSHSVFLGEVIDVEKEGKKKHFTFRVEKYWKGVSEKKVLLSVSENFRYQAPFKKGGVFLVFAKINQENGKLWDGRCSRSTRASEYSSTYEEDLTKLGKGKIPIESEYKN